MRAGVLPAQSVHAYKDANGQWVFTDRGTNEDGARGHATSVPHSPEALRVAVERSDTGAATRITASNDCRACGTLFWAY